MNKERIYRYAYHKAVAMLASCIGRIKGGSKDESRQRTEKGAIFRTKFSFPLQDHIFLDIVIAISRDFFSQIDLQKLGK